MTSFVVATSGHVDHGKSTLVRALTGIEPDRLEEERRRGLTIDLGFAWMQLPSGREVAFVDVPGHERFLGNMLAGLGPAPVVMFVVAVDQGWQQQSTDHLDAAVALGIEHGLIVLTRCDLAPDAVDAVRDEVRERVASTPLATAPIVAVSARDGTGLDAVRDGLDRVLGGVAAPDADAPVRFWVDRSFSITGAGTVVTGTLADGRIAVDDALELAGAHAHADGTRVDVRGLQSREHAVSAIGGVNRVAVNVRGLSASEVRRGDALLTPSAWWRSAVIDVRRVSGPAFDEVARELTVHVGSAAVHGIVRPFGADHARLQLARTLPLRLGDRLVVRDQGTTGGVLGAQVLDVDPPQLGRRGDGRRREAQLASMSPTGSLAVELARRGAMRVDHATRMGVPVPRQLPEGVARLGPWLAQHDTVRGWAKRLVAAVDAHASADPLSAGLSHGAAVDAIGLPDAGLLATVVKLAELEQGEGRIRRPVAISLGAAERGVAELERSLVAAPFSAPEADDLARLRLGVRELAAAERAGRLLRLGEGLVLLPTAPALAMRRLAALPQPFTTSQARQALSTSRRVAIPLLELLDRRGWTRRVDDAHREVVR